MNVQAGRRCKPGFSNPRCLRAVERFQADYAVPPAENMVDGIIGTTFDALIDFHDSVKVCDELHLPVHLVLAAAPSAAMTISAWFYLIHHLKSMPE